MTLTCSVTNKSCPGEREPEASLPTAARTLYYSTVTAWTKTFRIYCEFTLNQYLWLHLSCCCLFCKDLSEYSPQSHRTSSNRLLECVKAIALCHNVSPVTEDPQSHDQETGSHDSGLDSEQEEVVLYSKVEASRRRSRISYQASSPDEVRLAVF